MNVLNRRELGQAVFVSFFLAVFLAAGFLPTSQQLARELAPKVPTARGELFAFPLLAALFYFSLPSRQRAAFPFGDRRLWSTLIPPVILAAVFGHWHHAPSLPETLRSAAGRAAVFWTVGGAVIGEECLFRGWLYNVVDRVWARGMASATNPLPVAVWMTAMAFSIWHLQNLGTEPRGMVLFQSTYTFFTGLWLGYLRWKTGALWLPLIAHASINAAALLF